MEIEEIKIDDNTTIEFIPKEEYKVDFDKKVIGVVPRYSKRFYE